MKKAIIYVLLFCVSMINAQKKIAGSYHVSSGNPDDGGYNWMLLENHDFAMFTFGRMIAGKWSMDAGNEVTFTPSIPKYPFEIFGRYNPEVKGTKVMFNNFDINEDTFIGNSQQGMQPVLNQDANCLPYPLLKEFENKFNDILLSVSLYQQGKGIVYQSDIQKYNDFIILYYPSHVMVQPFKADFKNGKLYFRGDGKPSTERKDINLDELNEIEKYIGLGISSFFKESIVSNKAYNIISYGMGEYGDFDESSFLELNYNYDASTEIYAAKEKNEVSDDDYHDVNTLYKYHKVEIKPSQTVYKMSDKSIFNITCNE